MQSVPHEYLLQYIEFVKNNPDLFDNTKEDKPSSYTICRLMAKELNLNWRMKYTPKINTYNQTFTLTFGDQGENSKGMVKIGTEAKEGFNLSELIKAQNWFDKREIINEIICLNDLLSAEDEKLINSGLKKGDVLEEAYVLVIRNGLSAICKPDKFYEEQEQLEKDRKTFMYGKVVNKHARANLCFGDEHSEPDYENKMGTVYAWSELPLLEKVKKSLPKIIGEKAKICVCEGNYYENLPKSYIGFHGDAERKWVIAVRVGAAFPLYYQWHFKNEKIGELMKIDLYHGDIYIMSSKAVGTDWKRSVVPTLRHAAAVNEKLIKL